MIRYVPGLAFWLFCSTSVFAHPHFFKETTFRWDREDSPEARKITLAHMTVPYNEIKAGKLPLGDTWHLGFARLETTLDLECGETKIPAGKYELKGRRETEDRWSLILVSGKGDEKKTIEPDCSFDGDLPLADHLTMNAHPDGVKENTSIWVSVRFGDLRVRFPIEPQ